MRGGGSPPAQNDCYNWRVGVPGWAGNDERDWGGEAPGRRTRPKAEAKGGVRGGGSPPHQNNNCYCYNCYCYNCYCYNNRAGGGETPFLNTIVIIIFKKQYH